MAKSAYILGGKFKSNWEVLIWLELKNILLEPDSQFHRSHLIKQNVLDGFLRALGTIGHNANSDKPENTVQSYLNKMTTKKGFFERVEGNEGWYRITDKGYLAMREVEQAINEKLSGME